jgi:hypothetical protein
MGRQSKGPVNMPIDLAAIAIFYRRQADAQSNMSIVTDCQSDASRTAKHFFADETGAVMLFPNAAQAVQCAIEAQINDLTDRQGQRTLKAAVLHQSKGFTDETITEKAKHNLKAVLDKADYGGVAIGRTVYEEIRSKFTVEFDLLPDMSDVPFACTIMRQEGRHVDLIANSAVRIRPKAIVSFVYSDAASDPIYNLLNPYKWFSRAKSHGNQ